MHRSLGIGCGLALALSCSKGEPVREAETQAPMAPNEARAIPDLGLDPIRKRTARPSTTSPAEAASVEPQAPASTQDDELGKPEVAPAAVPGALFGLRLREHDVWLLPSSRYTVKKRDGTVLAEEIGDDKLLLDYPELYEAVHRSLDVSDEPAFGIGDD